MAAMERNEDQVMNSKISDHTKLLDMIKKLKPVHFPIYVTGADVVPASGWPTKPCILFNHDAQSSLIQASTCGLRATLPITRGNESLNSFLFSFAISMAHGATFNDI